jgi:hypothetical protein
MSDRDRRFNSKFWSSLRKLLGAKLKMSSAFHPETDGHSERAFGAFQEMVRALVDVLQWDWGMHIAQIEFVYNNTANDTTGLAPFYVAYGEHPPTCTTLLVKRCLCATIISTPLPNTFVSEAQCAVDAVRKALRMETSL